MPEQAMNTTAVITKLKELVNQAGNQQRAADVVKNETGFAMPQSTISRMCKGEAKPGLIFLTVYVLEMGLKKQTKSCESHN